MPTEAPSLSPNPEWPTSGEVRRLDQLPGPRGWPLLGNLFELDPQRLPFVLEGWAREHGSLYAFRAGPKTAAVVSDPALSDQVLRARPDDFRRISKIETVFAELNLLGVFSAEGASWRLQRRLLTQALSARRTTTFYPTLSRVIERLRQRWQKAAASGAVLDVLDEFKRLTVDVTTLLAFGHDVNTIEHEEDALHEQLQVVFPAISRRLTAKVPYWRVLPIPAERRAERRIRELRTRLQQLIVATRQRLDADPCRREAPANLLEALLTERDDEGQPFSDEMILGNALQVLVAGEDTTAATLAWAVHLLCEHPDAVATLRGELGRVLGAHPFPTDAEMAGGLSELDAILQETLRLRSVTPFLLLESNRDLVLHGLAIPCGTWVIILTRVAGVDAAHFEKPLEFLPQRWQGRSREATDVSQRASIPFGGGARICPGRALAMLEMRAALAMLYSEFEVERVGSAERVAERFAFIVEPVGLEVKLRLRSPRTP